MKNKKSRRKSIEREMEEEWKMQEAGIMLVERITKRVQLRGKDTLNYIG